MNTMPSLQPGRAPLLVSMPHAGTFIPAALQSRLVERASQSEDTDWHLERLYGFVTGLGASVIVPRVSRYVIDLNRPSDNQPMYPGRNNTELCPTRFFTGEPLYRPGCAPDEAEVRQRVAQYWHPYHDMLQAELARLRAQHGHVVLFDAHSIKGLDVAPFAQAGYHGLATLILDVGRGLKEVVTISGPRLQPYVMQLACETHHSGKAVGRELIELHVCQLLIVFFSHQLRSHVAPGLV